AAARGRPAVALAVGGAAVPRSRPGGPRPGGPPRLRPVPAALAVSGAAARAARPRCGVAAWLPTGRPQRAAGGAVAPALRPSRPTALERAQGRSAAVPSDGYSLATITFTFAHP